MDQTERREKPDPTDRRVQPLPQCLDQLSRRDNLGKPDLKVTEVLQENKVMVSQDSTEKKGRRDSADSRATPETSDQLDPLEKWAKSSVQSPETSDLLDGPLRKPQRESPELLELKAYPDSRDDQERKENEDRTVSPASKVPRDLREILEGRETAETQVSLEAPELQDRKVRPEWRKVSILSFIRNRSPYHPAPTTTRKCGMDSLFSTRWVTENRMLRIWAIQVPA